MAPHQVAVIGSLNIDFIIRTPRVPAAGETLTAHSFDQGFGGKGANQAVAAGRLADEHVRVAMVGNVGDDAFGDQYLDALKAEGIDGGNVRKLEGQKTGISTIIVDDASGENRILFTPNANYIFGKKEEGMWDVVPKEAEVVVFQMEIPVDVVRPSSPAKHEKHVGLILIAGTAQCQSCQRGRQTRDPQSSSSASDPRGDVPPPRHPDPQRDRSRANGRWQSAKALPRGSGLRLPRSRRQGHRRHHPRRRWSGLRHEVRTLRHTAGRDGESSRHDGCGRYVRGRLRCAKGEGAGAVVRL